MSTAADAIEIDPIERRYGVLAAAEWRTLLNLFELAGGFTLIVQVVPDMAGARLCRDELQTWLVRRSRRLEVIEPTSPAALHVAAETLFNLPEDPYRGAIWLAAAPGPEVPEPDEWDLAWRHALVGLNQQRNRLRRQFRQPLVLVGNDRLVPIMQEVAVDLWSVRSLSLRIEPGREALIQATPLEPMREQPEAFQDGTAPDPELALRMADRLRGRPGQESGLATLLARAGHGFAARGRWAEAEAALREAADLFEQFGPQPEAIWSWITLGDRFVATRRTDQARNAYAKAAATAERLARAEPDRADYQRDLAASYDRMGYLYRALGQGEAAREAFANALAIAERLARAEPDRPGYQRDLSVSYERMGDLYGALGQGKAARETFAKVLAIAERLARAEPDRADYQRDLAASYDRMGDLYRALGQGEAAREAFAKALAIAERLARAEPDRAGYQRDLSVSFEKMGDLYRALGQGEAGREAFAKALAIAERLARAEPDRADYQRDLSVSYSKMGDVYFALGQAEAARQAYAKALDIAERLARAEPDRADYQRDLGASYQRMGDLYSALDQGEAAREIFAKLVEIFERLVGAEPDRADYQRDLVASLVRQAQITERAVAREHVQRALGIVEALQASGRLAPSDAWMLPVLRQLLDAPPP